jgi:hypothetical protein
VAFVRRSTPTCCGPPLIQFIRWPGRNVGLDLVTVVLDRVTAQTGGSRTRNVVSLARGDIVQDVLLPVIISLLEMLERALERPADQVIRDLVVRDPTS